MPEMYIQEEHSNLEQIRFLIHGRGHFFTNVSIESHEVINFDKNILK